MSSTMDANVLLHYPSSRLKQRKKSVLGDGFYLRSGTVIYEGSTIGPGLETGHNVVIREQNRLGKDVRVWNNSTIDYGCRIGNGVKIHCNCYVSQFSVLEDGAFLAPGVMLANDLYPGFREGYLKMRGPHVGRKAQLGVNVTVLPYISIGAGALIGAGTVVTKNVPAGAVVWGNPGLIHGKVNDLRVHERLRLLNHG